jgi:aromatic ring-opening dioxygenase catalytic subunit (LigB family)
MATFAGAFAASHGPLIVRDWDKVTPDHKSRLTDAFKELGRRVAASNLDILVVVSPDHWINFFVDNLPAVCIGLGTEHDGPPEPFLKDFPHKTVAGAPAFGQHLLETALASNFDPAASHRVTLDHGICIPLWLMELPHLPGILPLFVNCLEAPMPSPGRCLQWGAMLRQAIDSYHEDIRVGILATGGLSHSIGEPTMGDIDEAFDRTCIDLFETGTAAPLTAHVIDNADAAGNGTHEVRNWLVAHGAAGEQGFELVDYLAVPEVYVGCGFASWRIEGS